MGLQILTSQNTSRCTSCTLRPAFKANMIRMNSGLRSPLFKEGAQGRNSQIREMQQWIRAFRALEAIVLVSSADRRPVYLSLTSLREVPAYVFEHALSDSSSRPGFEDAARSLIASPLRIRRPWSVVRLPIRFLASSHPRRLVAHSHRVGLRHRLVAPR
jgi:hypothetical protein